MPAGSTCRASVLWYEQAGTPRVTARLSMILPGALPGSTSTQTIPPTPGQPDKQPMPIPLRTALIGEASGAEIAGERLVLLDEQRQTILFEDVDEPPLLSINRDFSAPVIIEAERRPGELERLAECDHRPVRPLRGDAGADAARSDRRRSRPGCRPAPVIAAIGSTLRSDALDAAFKGEAILLPSESLIGDRMDIVDPDAIHAAREHLRGAIGNALAGELAAAYRPTARQATISARAPRACAGCEAVALGLIAAARSGRGAALAKAPV